MTETALTTSQAHSPVEIMQQAMASGVKPEDLEKMLSLQMKWEENEAKKAYVRAMAAFKKNPPEIIKNQHVKFTTTKGVTEYDHANLAEVSNKINEGLSIHGLSASWSTKQENNQIYVTCKITHELGHSEETSLNCGADTSGGKNAIQGIGSTITYLERYTLLSLTGLATKGMDNDGAGAPPETITAKQKTEMEKIITDKGVDEAAFLGYMKAESIDDIKLKDHKKAMVALNKAQGKKETKK